MSPAPKNPLAPDPLDASLRRLNRVHVGDDPWASESDTVPLKQLPSSADPARATRDDSNARPLHGRRKLR